MSANGRKPAPGEMVLYTLENGDIRPALIIRVWMRAKWAPLSYAFLWMGIMMGTQR